MLKRPMIAIALAATLVAPAIAEVDVYGNIYLGGLARDVQWSFNAAGETNVMVCNVNGPDGYLSVRSGPGTGYAEIRSFNRLAILIVDTRQRDGNWVKVVDGMRSHTAGGVPQDFKRLPVTGWAHDSYLCSFQD